MTTLEKIELLLTKLHPAEKVQLITKGGARTERCFSGYRP